MTKYEEIIIDGILHYRYYSDIDEETNDWIPFTLEELTARYKNLCELHNDNNYIEMSGYLFL